MVRSSPRSSRGFDGNLGKEFQKVIRSFTGFQKVLGGFEGNSGILKCLPENFAGIQRNF